MKPIPSIAELYDKLEADLKNKLNLSDSDLKFVVDAMAAVLAGQLKLIYLYLQDVENNQFPDTADLAIDGGSLERLGRIYLNRAPFPAKNGIYKAAVTGTVGAVIRGQLTFKSSDNSNAPGNLYILNSEYTMPGANGVITLESVSAGLDYLLKIGDILGATEPVLGINDQNIIITEVTQAPIEAENTDVYRQAILDAIRLQPQGGAKTDYREWAFDAQGVKRVYSYVKNGEAGTVQVYVEATIADSTDGKGTPSGALLTAVEDVIEFSPDNTIPTNDRGRRPIQANLEVLPVHPVPVDILVTGLQTNTNNIRATILTNLKDYVYNVRPYISGADLPRDKNDILTAVKLQSVITDTIGNANTFLSFKMQVDGVQVNSSTFSLANIPYIRNVIYN